MFVRKQASAILQAQGLSQATVLEAEGRAKAITIENEANVAAIKRITESRPSREAIEYRKYDALERVAASPSSKLIIPAELSSLSSSTAIFGEILKDSSNKDKDNKNDNIK